MVYLGLILVLITAFFAVILPIHNLVQDYLEEKWARHWISDKARINSIYILTQTIKNLDGKIMVCDLTESDRLMLLARYKDSLQEAIEALELK